MKRRYYERQLFPSQILKSDNFIGSNRKNSYITNAILEKSTKILSHFGCTNTIFVTLGPEKEMSVVILCYVYL